MHLEVSSVKWRPFCLGLNVSTKPIYILPPMPYYHILQNPEGVIYRVCSCLIILKFDRFLTSSAAQAPVKFHDSRILLTSNRMALRLFESLNPANTLSHLTSHSCYEMFMLIILYHILTYWQQDKKSSHFCRWHFQTNFLMWKLHWCRWWLGAD